MISTVFALSSLCLQPHLRPTVVAPARAATPVLAEQWNVDAIGKATLNTVTDVMAFVVEKIDTALSEEPIIDATKSEPIHRPKAAQITPRTREQRGCARQEVPVAQPMQQALGAAWWAHRLSKQPPLGAVCAR